MCDAFVKINELASTHYYYLLKSIPYTIFKFLQFSPNVLYLFQDPNQDTTLYLAVMTS